MRMSKKTQIEANKEVLLAVDRYNEEIKGSVYITANVLELVKRTYTKHLISMY